ncbi:MAG: adenylate/guanylate cyclase domain-containing protein [Myxococcota bacterium]
MAEPGTDFVLKPWQRFHVRLSLFNGMVVFAILTAMGFAFYDIAYSSEFKALQDRLRSTVSILSQNIDVDALAKLDLEHATDDPYWKTLHGRLEKLVWEDENIGTAYILVPTDDPDTLRFVLDTADADDDAPPGEPNETYPVDTALIKDGFDHIAVEGELTADKYGPSIGGYAPLKRSDGKPFGLIGVDVYAKHIEAMRDRIIVTALIVYGLAFAALALVAWVIGRRIRGPIAAINGAAGRIAAGDFEGELAIHSRDEFGLMTHHFNVIAKSLKERDFLRDTFGRYVSPDIARRVLQDRSAALLGGEERNVTVVFSDIEGYSTMTELVTPQETLGMLNTYLAAMNEIIDRHDGCIIEFLGDAILTVFNAPNDVANHAEVGVKCALAMRARLNELNQEWQKLPIAHIWQQAGKTALRARIGIHSGQVVAGNIGSKTRMKYGLIGDVVNLAARIESLNKKLSTTMLASAETVEALAPETRALGSDQGTHDVKGRAHGVQVYAF